MVKLDFLVHPNLPFFFRLIKLWWIMVNRSLNNEYVTDSKDQ